MMEKFKTGTKLIVSGKPTINKRSGLEVVHPDTEQLKGENTVSLEIGKIVPVYHVTEGLHQKSIRNILSNVLEKYMVEQLPLVASKLKFLHWLGMYN